MEAVPASTALPPYCQAKSLPLAPIIKPRCALKGLTLGPLRRGIQAARHAVGRAVKNDPTGQVANERTGSRPTHSTRLEVFDHD